MKDVRTEAVYEGGRIVLLARIEKDDATRAQQADFDPARMTINVYDPKDRSNAVATATLDVTEVIEDTLQTGNGWTLDSAQNPDSRSGLYGWNFRYVTPNDFFPQGGRDYHVELEAVAANDGTEDGIADAARDYQTWIVPTINLNRR